MSKKSLLMPTLLSAFCICAGITSCGSGKIHDPKLNPSSTSSQDKPSSSIMSSDYSPNFIADPTSEKIVKEKITINLFVPKASIHGEWEEMKLFKKMEERTNVHIEFTEVPLDGYTTQRNLSMTENKIDGYFLSNSAGQVDYERDALLDLTDLIETYAPNYKKYMAKYPEMKRVSTSRNGAMYSFSSINLAGGDAAKQYINKTWLDKFDLPVPTTVDEYYYALKTFMEQDANGNGIVNDEIPLSFINEDQTRNFLISAFGYTTFGVELTHNKDALAYVPSTDAYREYLKYCNTLYADKLLDANSFSQKSGDLAYKGNHNLLGSFASSGSFLVVGNELDTDYTAVGPLTSSINSNKIWYQFDKQSEPTVLVIRKSSKYPRELVRWIDVFYEESYEMLQTYGEEGVDWNWNNPEHNSFKFNVPQGMAKEEYRATLTFSPGLGASVVATDKCRYEDSVENQKIYKEFDVYRPYWKDPIPVLHFTDEESEELSSIEASLGAYVGSCEAAFIKSESGFNPYSDTDWSNYVNQLRNKRYERLLELYWAAYLGYLGQ